MTTRADTWTVWRSLAFLAAVFAVVLGALLPSAALAGSRDGRPIVMCSAEGPRTIRVGGDGNQTDGLADAACAFCIASDTSCIWFASVDRSSSATTSPAFTTVPSGMSD